jgi:poly-beta-hydroxybutyrate-responsive repressor
MPALGLGIPLTRGLTHMVMQRIEQSAATLERVRQQGGVLKNFVRPFLLLMLAERSDHGYNLVARLATFGITGEAHTSVYRALQALERSGFARSKWNLSSVGPAKRIYEITPEGIGVLQAWVRVLAEKQALVQSFISKYDELSMCVPHLDAEVES